MSDYFGSSTSSEGSPRIVTAAELKRFTVADGVAISPVLGALLNINVVTLEAGAVAAVHSHDEEQIGFVVKGVCEFTDGVRTWMLSPGDCYHCPPNVPHGARAVGEGCVTIDAFAPPRAGIKELLDGNT